MILYTTLVAEIAGKLKIDNNDEDVARFQVVASINAAQRHLLIIMPAKYITEALKTVTGDLADGVSRYQWPADFIRFKDLWLSYDSAIIDSNPGRKAQEVADCRDVSNIDEMPNQSYPKMDLNVELGFELRPIPTAAQVNGFRLQYIQRLPNVSESQNCLLGAHLQNLVVYYGTHLSAIVEGSKPEVAKQMWDMYLDEEGKFIPKEVKG